MQISVMESLLHGTFIQMENTHYENQHQNIIPAIVSTVDARNDTKCISTCLTLC